MNAQQQGQTLMAYEDVAALMYEEGYWLWKLAKPTQRGSAWTLSRALPNGKRRTVWLAPALGAALGARWPHDRKRNLHGMLDGVDIMRRLAAAPPQDQYPLMAAGRHGLHHRGREQGLPRPWLAPRDRHGGRRAVQCRRLRLPRPRARCGG
jgi:hypothetical protein